MKFQVFPIVITIFLICCSGCVSNHEQQKKQTDEAEFFCLNEQMKRTTDLVEVNVRPIVEQLSLSGKIAYNENDLVSFRSLLMGVVEKVRFELGDQVKKGQVLAEIKSTEIQALFQQKKSQNNQILLLERLLHTQKTLLKDGMISEPEMLKVEHDLELARIELSRIDQSLELYHAIGESIFQVLAPKDGYIIQKDISPGQIITQDSESLFTISNLKEVWVMVNVYASNLKYIATGNQVKVRTIAYPDQIYNGKIDKIYNVFDADEHVMKARVILENRNLNLMPGLSADILFEIERKNEMALAVPNKSLVFSNNENFIIVYNGECKIECQKVEILAKNEEFTYISGKLQPNQKVIGSNALLIFEQLRNK